MQSKPGRKPSGVNRPPRLSVTPTTLVVLVLTVFVGGLVLGIYLQEHVAHSANHALMVDLESLHLMHRQAQREVRSTGGRGPPPSVDSRRLEHNLSGNSSGGNALLERVGKVPRDAVLEASQRPTDSHNDSLAASSGRQVEDGTPALQITPDTAEQDRVRSIPSNTPKSFTAQEGSSSPLRREVEAQAARSKATAGALPMRADGDAAAGSSPVVQVPRSATLPPQPLLRSRQIGPVQVRAKIAAYLNANKKQFVQTEHPADSHQVTVSAWVNPDADDTSSQLNDMRTVMTNRLSGCGTTPQSFGYSLFLNNWSSADGAVVAEWTESMGACQKLSSAPGQVPSGSWSHLVAVFDTNQVTLYLNGRDIASRPSHSRLTQSSSPLFIGRVPPSNEGEEYLFYGKIARVAVFGSAFNSAQVQILHASTAAEGLQSETVHDKLGEGASPLLLLPLDDAETSGSHGGDATKVTGIPLKEEQQKKIGAKLKSTLPDVTPRAANPSANSLPKVASPALPSPSLPKTAVAEPTITLSDLNYGFDVDRVVTVAMKQESNKQGAQRSQRIREAMQHAWQGYKKYAWGFDEVKPQSSSKQNNWGAMGVTLVDSLDTLWIMGMHKEFKEARDWVASSLTFASAGEVSVFETTIRELGGLLGAYDLSGDRVFLDKARALGDLLLPAFDTPSGVPVGRMSLGRKTPARLRGSGRSSVLAEVGTLQVEFRYLSKATGNPIYAEKANRVFDLLRNKDKDGLYGVNVDTNTGSVTGKVTFGALGDSFYEYLLKAWLQGGKKESSYRQMYDRAVDATIRNGLWRQTTVSRFTVLADYEHGRAVRKMDHLACFMAGTLALGAYTSGEDMSSGRSLRDLRLAQALANSCYNFYKMTPSGLSPEYVTYGNPNEDFTVPANAPYYILRPEVAESLFVLHQVTGDPIYREWGWEIFQAIEKNCKTSVAFGAYSDVRKQGIKADDRMESFFLAETLKYLYLLQVPETKIDLNEFVLNTEAHPLRSFA